MSKLEAPQDLVKQYDFTIEDLCLDCPLRSVAPDFQPGYGVVTWESPTGETRVLLTDLATRWKEKGKLVPNLDSRQITLSADEVVSPYDVQEAFEDCKQPVTHRRRVLPNKKICGAIVALAVGPENIIKMKDC